MDQSTRIKAINQMHAAYAQAEIRIAKQVQRMYPNRMWIDCLKEAKGIITRHGINVELIEE